MNLINKISNWLFGKKDSLSKECESVYTELEEKYASKEKITDSHLTKQEYLNSLSTEKKQLLVDNKEEISNKIDKDVWKTYLRQSKKVDEIDINNPSAGNDYLLSVEPIPLLKVIDSVKFENHKKEIKNAEEYVSKSMLVKGEDKPLEVNVEKAKTIKQNKKRKYTKKK